MNKLVNRLFSDYLMPSRLTVYEQFLVRARDAGYTQMSVRDFWRCRSGDNAKIVVHRHDVDTDLRTARKMFELEQRYGVRSTFYFRLLTLAPEFMREIEAYGSEASYHFEEVAEFAKTKHIRCASTLRLHMGDIADQFFINFTNIEERLGVKLSTVSSHGDFVNRRLRIINNEVLAVPGLRVRCGIACEAYDPELLTGFDIYIRDQPYPRNFLPISPFDALGRYARIYFLTHPIQWETNWAENTRHNVQRLYEELVW